MANQQKKLSPRLTRLSKSKKISLNSNCLQTSSTKPLVPSNRMTLKSLLNMMII